MSILGLIPARGGSKGIPKKNIKKLAGKELIRYTIEAGLGCKSIDELVVSTDDELIAGISRKAGAKVPFLRPDDLASDQAPTVDAVIHAVRFYEQRKVFFDAVCILQATCPFRTSSDIEQAIKKFGEEEADALISVRKVPHQYNPHWVFEPIQGTPFLKIATGDETIIPRRQELPEAYHRDGSIYIVKSAILLQRHSLFGEKTAFYLSGGPWVNIDTPEDWQRAEHWLKTGKMVR